MKVIYSILTLICFVATTSVSAQEVKWKTFKDKKMGYSVEYPKKWKARGGDYSFICGEEPGMINADFTIQWSSVNDKERIDFIFNNDVDFYKNCQVDRETVTISGIKAEHIVATKVGNATFYSEVVILKTPEKWYRFENSGVKDNKFVPFFMSFTFL